MITQHFSFYRIGAARLGDLQKHVEEKSRAAGVGREYWNGICYLTSGVSNSWLC